MILQSDPIVSTTEDGDGNQIRHVRSGGAGAPYAYVSLTDVCDKTRLQLQFVSLKQNAVIFEKSLVIPCRDRLATVELIFQLPDLWRFIAEAGEYAFQVVCAGELIGSYRIRAESATNHRGLKDV